MDRVVPGRKSRPYFGFVASPHSRCDNARRTTPGDDRLAEMVTTIGTVGKDLVGIIRQGIRAGFAIVDIGGGNGDVFNKSRVSVSTNIRLEAVKLPGVQPGYRPLPGSAGNGAGTLQEPPPKPFERRNVIAGCRK